MGRLAVTNQAGRTLEASVARAATAEDYGYESIWVTQLPYERDAAVVLAAYAQRTERVKLGTGVLPIYTRHPTAMAQMAASLDELSGGRFILGMGISHKVTVEAMWGLKLEKPVQAMREYLTIVRQGLTGAQTDFDGDFFSAHAPYFAPIRPELPVMISALNPRMLDLAGQLADGIVLWMCTADYIRDKVVPAVRAGRERVGKNMDGFEIASVLSACITSSRDAGHDELRETVGLYSSLPFYRKMMDASGLGPDLEADPIGVRALDELAAVGDKARLRDTIARYRAAGVTLPIIAPFGDHSGAAGFDVTMETAAAS